MSISYGMKMVIVNAGNVLNSMNLLTLLRRDGKEEESTTTNNQMLQEIVENGIWTIQVEENYMSVNSMDVSICMEQSGGVGG